MELLSYFGPQVPGQNHDEIWFLPLKPLLVDDRNPAARHVLPLLRRVSIDDKRQQIRSDACIVKERVALRGCAITGDALPCPLGLDEKRHEIILHTIRL